MRLSVLILLVFFASCSHAPQTGQRDLCVDEVTIDTYKQFEAQLRRDLPIGTSANTVRDYLDKAGIEHSFAPYDKSQYALIRKINRYLLIFTTDLWIRFRLSDEHGKLTAIDVDLVHTGL